MPESTIKVYTAKGHVAVMQSDRTTHRVNSTFAVTDSTISVSIFEGMTPRIYDIDYVTKTRYVTKYKCGLNLFVFDYRSGTIKVYKHSEQDTPIRIYYNVRQIM